MSEARQRESWDHTAALEALIYNCNRDPKKGSPAKPGDFHPFIARGRPSKASKNPRIPMSMLGALCAPQKGTP